MANDALTSDSLTFKGISQNDVQCFLFLWLKFEPGILEACIYILKRAFSQKTTQDMGDPVSVTKKVASIVSIAM